MKLTDEQLEYLQPNYEDRHRIEQEEQQYWEDVNGLQSKEDEAHQAEHMKLEDSLIQPYWRPTKSNAMAAAQMVKKQVDEGFLNPLELNIRLKNLMDFCKQAIELTEEAAIVEAEKYGKGETYLEAHVEVKKARDNFKFDHYEEWCKLKEKMKGIEEKMKASYKTGTTVIDGDEVIPPAKNEPSKNCLTVKHAA